MIRFGKILFGIVTVIFCGVVSAYEIRTHERLSTEAYDVSQLRKIPEIFRNLGIKDVDKFKNSENNERTIPELIADGARFEDGKYPLSLKPLFHFFDPLNDEGLYFFTSPTWALEDKGKTHFLQNYSYRDARDYLYKALTLPSDAERKKYFGKTFEAVGHIIHHIQDMAQPQHTRLDAHLNLNLTNEELPFENRSGYEIYTEKEKLGSLPLGGYAPVNDKSDSNYLTTARSFWHTESKNPAAGKGLAEFTNTNFVSAGTNFDTQHYPSPRLAQATPHDENANTLLQSVGLPVPALCQPPNPPCVMTFYTTRVEDRYRPLASANNPRTSTASVFDQDLRIRNAPPAYTVNRFNFDEAHKFLIPRAVAYSAGIIDYFFRGRLQAIDAAFAAAGITFRVKNAIDPVKVPAWANETLYSAGSTLTLAYEYKLNDQPVVGSTASQPLRADVATGKTSTEVYTFAAPTIPSGARNVKYRLVFRGKLGQETDAVAVGSVEPISGFVLNPSYLPTDGISGVRTIYRLNGEWKLSNETGKVAGNIDWKGTHENGRATKVLTWSGPEARYFPNRFGDPFQLNIYQQGELFSVAPAPVLGAAIAKDSNNQEWIVAICWNDIADVVYKRRNIKNTSSALYDAQLAPEGWRLMDTVTSVPDALPADRPWFFNGAGTEAQTLRRLSAGGTSRLKLMVGPTSVSFTNLGNTKSKSTWTAIKRWENCDWVGGAINVASVYEYSEGIGSGETIVAVDYREGNEILAKIVVKNNIQSTLTGGGGSTKQDLIHSSNEQKTLQMGSTPLTIYRYVENTTQTLGPPAKIERTISTEDKFLLYMDLRHEVVVFQQTDFSDQYVETFSSLGAGSYEQTSRTGSAYEAWDHGRVVDIYRRAQTTNKNGSGTMPSFMFCPSCYCFAAPSNNKNESLATAREDWEEIRRTEENAGFGVDTAENFLFSLRYYDANMVAWRIFNYLTGSELTQIIPPGADPASYHPIRVIR